MYNLDTILCRKKETRRTPREVMRNEHVRARAPPPPTHTAIYHPDRRVNRRPLTILLLILKKPQIYAKLSWTMDVKNHCHETCKKKNKKKIDKDNDGITCERVFCVFRALERPV